MDRWKWAAVVLGGATLLVLLITSFVVPPSSGPGWRLDPDGRWGMPAVVDDVRPTAVVYLVSDTEVGIGITVYGSSSCPPRVWDVDVAGDVVTVRTSIGLQGFGGCTADAAPHQYGIRVERDRIGGDALTVVVVPDDGQSGSTDVDLVESGG